MPAFPVLPIRLALATTARQASGWTMVAVIALGLACGPGPVQAQSPPRASLVAPTFPPGSEAAEISRLQREGDHAAAIARAETTLAKNPRDAQVRFLRAVSLAEARREADAIAAFEAMTQEFPELPEPYNNLAVLRAAQSRFDEARALLLRAIDVQPNYTTAIENLGDLYLALAAASYERALALDARSAPLKTKLQLAREVAAKVQAAR